MQSLMSGYGLYCGRTRRPELKTLDSEAGAALFATLILRQRNRNGCVLTTQGGIRIAALRATD